ncbi:efflux RND transporter periplasmic adaptor subunit [Sphingobacterium deserti]|uniref:Efflux transporter, RND family, MFP subunit n=1 Tax=Sphingobacterium deserti TaxID=1229276 RepID=A0A0B8SZW1_9SPHI|nr:efflux RND transporter periplasmic adaptor subunit [Sphingobacterium deserti]KGE13572.1 efflux transporter, RND family, MFP subunit [Sphingobacterium deserti]
MKTSIRPYLFVATLAVAATIQSCHQADRSTDIPRTDTVPVALLSLHNSASAVAFEATGTFTTDDETMLSFKSGGVIEKMFVREGDAVRPGQLLARVHQDEIDAHASQARLAVEKAKRDYDRASKLYRDSVTTLEQMQNAQTALSVAQQDLKSIQFNKQYAEIRSTSNGYVLARLAQEGQVVGPGTPVFQVNSANEGHWELKVGVSDRQWSMIQIGDTASIRADVFGEQAFPASVTRKSEGLDPNTGTFSIFLRLARAPKNKLASGVFARAEFRKSSKQNAVWNIPYESLLDGNGKEGYVFVTHDNKTAKRVKVSLGGISADQVTVLSGLDSATALIVSGSPYLVDGAPIKVITQK